MEDDHREPCPHVMHLDVQRDDQTVRIDIDSDAPLPIQLAAILAAMEGLALIRVEVIAAYARMN